MHGNEAAHADHVAVLALRLFDATAELVGAPADDRPLLEAACRLHEVGYAANPRRHGRTGYDIIRREGLRGFPDVARGDIAAAIFLHPTQRRVPTNRGLTRRLRKSSRASRIAAYLRIADGLDTAHVQDAAIVGVRRTGRAIRVRVACGGDALAIAGAERKAGLWREIFPADIQFVRDPRPPAPLLAADLPIVEAARRLLYVSYRSLQIHAAGALDATDHRPLHATRVSIRRMRAVLRLFRKPLESTSAVRVRRDLRRLNAALGEVRDLDVWIDLLTDRTLRPQLVASARGRRFIDFQMELRRLQQATVRRHLTGASFSAFQVRVGRLLRIELPRLLRTSPVGALERIGRRAFAKGLDQVLDLADLRHAHSLSKQHRLRIALRRLRFLADMFGEMLGPVISVLGKRARAIERSLGRLRDAALALERARSVGPSPPRLLMQSLERCRVRAVTELGSSWKRFAQPRFLDKARRRLES